MYNNAGRLSAVKTATSTLGSYLYDAFGRRTVKTAGSTGSFFVYDPSGQLLEETDATGKAITDYVYVDGRVVDAWQVPKQQMVGVYTDRLGAPLIANDQYGLTAWKADYEPFGATSNVVTSNAYTGPVVQNMRLPGQYADAESGFSQNGFRDYVLQWGRYLESDPIGLAGGINTYAYVSGNPLKYTDRLGLDREIIVWNPMVHDSGSWAGHMSSIDGSGGNNSFGPSGWDKTYPAASDYINRQTEVNDRDGLGLVIDLSPEQDKKFDQCMSSIKKENEPYNKVLNNCTSGVQSCLIRAGISLAPAMTPIGVEQNLFDADVVKRVIWYGRHP